jgi:hypothetical protein
MAKVHQPAMRPLLNFTALDLHNFTVLASPLWKLLVIPSSFAFLVDTLLNFL